MTALQLVALISSALLLQIGAGIGAAFWRKTVDDRSPADDALPAPNAPATGAWSGSRDFRIVSRVFEDAARSQCSLLLEPVDAQTLQPYLPGQYLTLMLRIAGDRIPVAPGQAVVTRCYSLSDSPDTRSFRITVKRVRAPGARTDHAPGLASSWLVDHSQVGDILQVKAPAGRFVIDAASERPVVLIAGGIGITPLMSMLRWLLVEQPLREIHLYHGLRCGRDHAFKGILEELALARPNLHTHFAYSDPGLDDLVGRDFQHPGRVDMDLLRRTLPHGSYQFYLCGPSPMMADLVAGLRRKGVPEDDIHYEAFGPASLLSTTGEDAPPESASPSPSVDVRFNRSQRTLAWDGRAANLLAFAESHGVALESGCRAGSCGSCEVQLASGHVEYAHAPDYEVRSGYCLPCVATPATALVLEA